MQSFMMIKLKAFIYVIVISWVLQLFAKVLHYIHVDVMYDVTDDINILIAYKDHKVFRTQTENTLIRAESVPLSL
jgi:hypothetical protein